MSSGGSHLLAGLGRTLSRRVSPQAPPRLSHGLSSAIYRITIPLQSVFHSAAQLKIARLPEAPASICRRCSEPSDDLCAWPLLAAQSPSPQKLCIATSARGNQKPSKRVKPNRFKDFADSIIQFTDHYQHGPFSLKRPDEHAAVREGEKFLTYPHGRARAE